MRPEADELEADDLKDQNWRDVVAFLEKRVGASDCILLPSELKPHLKQFLACSYALTHKGIAPEHIQWAVLHKGKLNDISAAFLTDLCEQFRLRFANDVFVVLVSPRVSCQRLLLPFSPHVRAYRKQLRPLLQPRSMSRPDAEPGDFVSKFVSNVDTLLCSYPKCGRTWLRFMLTAYIHRLCEQQDPITFKLMHRVIPEYRREDNIPQEKRDAARQLQEKYDVPAIAVTHCSYDIALAAAILSRKDVVLMLRSPYDVLVSQYFERVYRQDYTPQETLWTFIQHEQLLQHIVSYLNGWADNLWRHRHLVLSYERLRQDTAGQLRHVLDFLQLPVDGDRLSTAIQLGSFENMRKLDRDRNSNAQPTDSEALLGAHEKSAALRVRRGTVGGYRDYLKPSEVNAMQSFCRDRLSPSAQRLLNQHGIKI